MLYFGDLIITYIFVCIFGVKYYFYLQKQNLRTTSKFKKNIVSYALFALFVCIEIQFAIFFPTWLNSKLMTFEKSSDSTMYLLLFGCLILGLSVWKARKERPSEF